MNFKFQNTELNIVIEDVDSNSIIAILQQLNLNLNTMHSSTHNAQCSKEQEIKELPSISWQDHDLIKHYNDLNIGDNNLKLDFFNRKIKDRLPNEYDEDGNPIKSTNKIKSYTSFMCPKCKQGLFLENKEKIIFKDPINNKIYMANKESISFNIEKFSGDNNNKDKTVEDLWNISKGIEELVEKIISENKSTDLELEELAYFVKDDTIFYTCPVCGSLEALTTYIEEREDLDYDACEICGGEKEIVMQPGEFPFRQCCDCKFVFNEADDISQIKKETID